MSKTLPVSRYDKGCTRGAADWLFCRDDRWRPVEPSTFPLAHEAAARVGRLRGYGNTVNAIQAKEFIMAYMNIAGRCIMAAEEMK